MILFEKQVIKQGDVEEPITKWQVGFWCPQGLALTPEEAIKACEGFNLVTDIVPCCIAVGSTLQEVVVRSI